MTVPLLHPVALTHESLEALYKENDPEVQERVNHLDFRLSLERNLEQSVCCFQFRGSGTERLAYYDPDVDLIYKRRHYREEGSSREYARLERISLYKAHIWLSSLSQNVRYADTRFHVAPSGVEYIVQEYIPTVGQHRFHDVLTDEVVDLLVAAKCADTGLSRDYVDGNVGYDPVTGGGVLIDLLEVRSWAWW